MSCPICGNKPINCDCTPGDRRAFDLEEKVDEMQAEIARLRLTDAEREALERAVILLAGNTDMATVDAIVGLLDRLL